MVSIKHLILVLLLAVRSCFQPLVANAGEATAVTAIDRTNTNYLSWLLDDSRCGDNSEIAMITATPAPLLGRLLRTES